MIDTRFDFRADAGGGDPDATSPTLRRYHQLLWSKPLPGGKMFELDVSTPFAYLHHRSALGEFWLTSDSMINTYLHWPRLRPITSQFTEVERQAFVACAYTIGGMIIFPGQRVGSRPTINGARGMHPRIRDRMDRTLECIRRFYAGESSPLEEVLGRYADFFSLFETFPGYVSFFLLDDMVTTDCSAVRFFTPFSTFDSPAVPADLVGYREYMRGSMAFVRARNRRIAALDLRQS